jgi:hypothetical protein
LSGGGFDLSASLELYYNGARIAVLNPDPSYSLPSSTTLAYNLDFGGIAGVYEIAVVNTSGLRSNLFPMMVYPSDLSRTLPLILTMSPSSIPASGPQMVTVHGRAFEIGLHFEVSLGGQVVGSYPVQPTGPYADTAFIVTVNLNGKAGKYDAAIVNPDGSRSPSVTLLGN